MTRGGLPPRVEEYIGRISGFVEAADEVNKAMIRRWCEMVEDANPLYTDERYAGESEYGGIISPPTMVITWGLPPQWPPQELPPDAKIDQQDLPLGDLPLNLSVESRQEYFLSLRPGDRLRYNTRLDDVSSLKETKLGRGHFITTTTFYYNQREELVATNQHILFRYRAGEQSLREDEGDEGS